MKSFQDCKIIVCIPTLNPGVLAAQMVEALKRQSLRIDQILVLDSASTDGSVNAFVELGAVIVPIRREDFDHGGTRNLAFGYGPADIYIFLTQDAIPVGRQALAILVQALSDNPSCGMAYGRQVPTHDASVLAQHARLFNYPAGDRVVIKKDGDVSRLGIKAAFCSNSFAAYRRTAIASVGFFPQRTLFAEDTYTAARLLQEGWGVAYVPNAQVAHSHNYSIKQDFCRYFDIGAFHAMNAWYIDYFGRVEGEGRRFVLSEYKYAKASGLRWPFFWVFLRNSFRWLGYRIGRQQNYLPVPFKRSISTNSAFWGRR